MNSKIIALLQIESKCHIDTSMSFVTSCYGSLNFQPISEITGILCQGIFGFFFLFPGQHQCVSVINNFFPKEKLLYYTKPQGIENCYTQHGLHVHVYWSIYVYIQDLYTRTLKCALCSTLYHIWKVLYFRNVHVVQLDCEHTCNNFDY